MNPQTVSIISTLLNLGLGISKLIFGFLIGSVALIADGIHSGVDVFSSFITFLGLKTARKPVDREHPYGHYRAESLAGFLVAILLAISGIWILYEAFERFFGGGVVRLSLGAILVVIISIAVTEFLARLKFYYGRKHKALSLVADAEHSRADALSSVGVLGGLFLIRYFNQPQVEKIEYNGPIKMEIIMKLESPVFIDNEKIPVKYTCDGEDVNPPLIISGVPVGAKSLALIVDDPDAPMGDWVHWLVWNINPQIRKIEEDSVPDGGKEGMTDFGEPGWGGPCPPSGQHRYQFKLYALDTLLDLDEQATKADLLAAMQGHVLAEVKLVGLYQREAQVNK